MYKYWGFGLKIASEIEFPELYPADFPVPDLKIVFGNVPMELKGEGVVKKAFSSISKEEYLWSVKNIGKYYAGYGSKIVVEPVAGTDDCSIRLFLLGTVMAAILYQRGNIPLHASAIVNKGKLVLFAGNSGAGKSTLLARLATKGYEIFTDDVCVLRQNASGNNELLGTSSYPMLKLWDDAIVKLNSDTYNKDFKIRPQLPKYGQFFYESFNTQSLQVDKIFILSPKNSVDEITINRLIPVQAFKKMEKQAYKFQLILKTELRGLHFSLLSHLISMSPVYEVSRPVTGSNIESLVSAVENLL